MGSSLPKQYIKLRGKSILWYTLDTFLQAFDDLQVILVANESHIQLAREISESTFQPGRVIITTGGDTRFHSVPRGLHFVREQSIVFVHDAVRCMVSPNLIHRCYEAAQKYGNAIPAIASTDSIRMTTDTGNQTIDRTRIRFIQTPQTFSSELLLAGFKQEYQDSFTDEASVIEKLGVQIHLVEGEETNIKITRPVDLLIAERIFETTHRI